MKTRALRSVNGRGRELEPEVNFRTHRNPSKVGVKGKKKNPRLGIGRNRNVLCPGIVFLYMSLDLLPRMWRNLLI